MMGERVRKYVGTSSKILRADTSSVDSPFGLSLLLTSIALAVHIKIQILVRGICLHELVDEGIEIVCNLLLVPIQARPVREARSSRLVHVDDGSI